MDRTFPTLLALALLFVAACTETPERGGVGITRVNMPEWASTGQHPDYPDSEYITAYGLARTVTQAREGAEGRLEEMICRHILDSHEPILKDTHFAKIVTEPAAWFQIDEFGDGVVSDDANNGFEAVSIRGINYDELKLRARSLLVDANQQLRETPMPPGGVGSLEKRLELWGDFFLKSVRVVALELLANDTLNRTVFEDLEEAVLSLWELPSLMKVNQQGDGQNVRIRGGVPEPVRLWGSFRGSGVEGIPLIWGPAPGFAGTVEGDAVFDENSGASAKVLYLQPNGNDWGYVAARIDLDAFMGRRLGIAMTLWMWQLKLPSINNGQLVLNVTEMLDGKTENVEPVLRDELKKWAKLRGLSVSDGEPSDPPTDYTIKLSGELDVKSAMQNGAPVALASGTLTLTNLRNGEELYRHTLGLRKTGQPGNTEASIRAVAQNEGAAECMIEFIPRIVAALPGEKDMIDRRRDGR